MARAGNQDSVRTRRPDRLDTQNGGRYGAVASCIIVFASWRRGVAPVTLARMVANILLETAVGEVPPGDVFHVFWKANRRNYRLLIREKEQPRAKTARDWIFLGSILLAVVLALAIPIAALIWLLRFRSR